MNALAEGQHRLVRSSLLSLIKFLPEIFRPKFCPVVLGKHRFTNIDEYIRYMRIASTREDPFKWGGYLEILAASILYECPVHIHVMDVNPKFTICYEESYLCKAPIRLSFEGGNHYNVIIAKGSRSLKCYPGEFETLRLSDVSIDNIFKFDKFVSMELSNKELNEILKETAKSTIFRRNEM